jgi:hypothetical protein
MPRKRTPAAASLALFAEEPIDRAAAILLCRRLPIGATLRQEYIRCTGACCKREGARGHGPYWIGQYRQGGRPRRIYIGSDAKKLHLERAWKRIRREIHALEDKDELSTREAQALAELQPLVYDPSRERRPRAPRSSRSPKCQEAVSIPIMGAAK